MLNSCGKDVFKISDIDMLKRFLFLGTEKGTYYINKETLTDIHLDSLERLLSDDSRISVVLNLVSDYGRKGFKMDYVIYVLARCCSMRENAKFRKEAYSLLPDICRTPTHLFTFIGFYEQINKKLHGTTGWNSTHKKAIAKWYLSKTPLQLAYHITKYKNRNGWKHADVLRLAHVKADKDDKGFIKDCIFKYITKDFAEFMVKTGDCSSEAMVEIKTYLKDYEWLIHGKYSSREAVDAIKRHNFVREHVPTSLLGDVDVWNALVQEMPMVALLRNLNKITAVGVFDKYPDTLNHVTDDLNDEGFIKKSKAHPLQFLIALKMYYSGGGGRNNIEYSPKQSICDALENAFKASFNNVAPTGKKYLLAIDVSGSMMGSTVCGVDCLMASEVATAMAMVIASVDSCDIMSFSEEFLPAQLNPSASLRENLDTLYYSDILFGATDCSLPMTYALENKAVYDAIIVFTDSETNCNSCPPVDMLRKYNKEMDIACKLIVVAASANDFSIADPDDPNMLDICGFDASTHECINEFISA